MKQFLLPFIASLFLSVQAQAQDNTQLPLDIVKANEANNEELKDYIWKRKAEVYVSGELKATTLTEVKFDEEGKMVNTLVDASTTVQQKPGLRGRAQQNAAEDKLDYVEHAVTVMAAYMYMSKGQMVDFFDKAAVTTAGGEITAHGTDVYVKGDSLTIVFDEATKLYKSKAFKSKSGADDIDGTIAYGTFQSNGLNHITAADLNMPAKAMVVKSVTQDYTQRMR